MQLDLFCIQWTNIFYFNIFITKYTITKHLKITLIHIYVTFPLLHEDSIVESLQLGK